MPIRITQSYGSNTIMISIPREYVNKLGIKKGEALRVEMIEEKIIISKLKEELVDYNTAKMIEDASLPEHLQVIEQEPAQTIDDMMEAVV